MVVISSFSTEDLQQLGEENEGVFVLKQILMRLDGNTEDEKLRNMEEIAEEGVQEKNTLFWRDEFMEEIRQNLSEKLGEEYCIEYGRFPALFQIKHKGKYQACAQRRAINQTGVNPV